jgi:hypothetical protein
VHLARFLTEGIARFEIAANLRPTAVNLASVHGIEEAALVVKREREQLVRPARHVMPRRKSLCFDGDARLAADIVVRHKDGKGPAAGAALVALVTRLVVSRVRH